MMLNTVPAYRIKDHQRAPAGSPPGELEIRPEDFARYLDWLRSLW